MWRNYVPAFPLPTIMGALRSFAVEFSSFLYLLHLVSALHFQTSPIVLLAHTIFGLRCVVPGWKLASAARLPQHNVPPSRLSPDTLPQSVLPQRVVAHCRFFVVGLGPSFLSSPLFFLSLVRNQRNLHLVSRFRYDSPFFPFCLCALTTPFRGISEGDAVSSNRCILRSPIRLVIRRVDWPYVQVLLRPCLKEPPALPLRFI